jgi:hypothetical protein
MCCKSSGVVANKYGAKYVNNTGELIKMQGKSVFNDLPCMLFCNFAA